MPAFFAFELFAMSGGYGPANFASRQRQALADGVDGEDPFALRGGDLHFFPDLAVAQGLTDRGFRAEATFGKVRFG